MHTKLKPTIIHVGINQFISNSAILKNYETAIKGIKDNYKSVATKATFAFHNVTLAPASGIAVNKK